MSEIYLKIYIENGDTIVFEGQGTEDMPGYYPARWDDTAKRFGTVVIGKKHISITDEAKTAFRRIIMEARHTGDDLSCLDICGCPGIKEDGTRSDKADDVCISYLGDVVTKWNIEEVINDKEFFIGTGGGVSQVSLLDALVVKESKKTKCSECCYCEMARRAAGWNGRGTFYCDNPEAKKLPQKVFGNKSACFICFGTAEIDTRPQIKTRPRWCPLNIAE